MILRFGVAATFFVLVLAAVAGAEYPEAFWARVDSLPEAGAVVRSETAIRIAEAIWLENYGKGIYRTRPFRAQLEGDEWRVSGTAADDDGRGGIPCARIDARNGRVIGILHTQ